MLFVTCTPAFSPSAWMSLTLWSLPGGVRVPGQFHPWGEQSWSLTWSILWKTSICHLNCMCYKQLLDHALAMENPALCTVGAVCFWHTILSSVCCSLPACMFWFSLVAQKIVATRKKQQLSIGPCKSLPNSPSHSSVCSAPVSAVHISQVQTTTNACLRKGLIGCFLSDVFNTSAFFFFFFAPW